MKLQRVALGVALNDVFNQIKRRSIMGEAKRRKELGITPKKLRFLYLLRKITRKWNEYQIMRFANIRFK